MIDPADQRPFDVVGEVVWVRPASGHMGLRLTSIDEGFRAFSAMAMEGPSGSAPMFRAAAPCCAGSEAEWPIRPTAAAFPGQPAGAQEGSGAGPGRISAPAPVRAPPSAEPHRNVARMPRWSGRLNVRLRVGEEPEARGETCCSRTGLA